MKLLSASAVVAGANSVVLADCGLCGERDHGVDACGHFNYEGFRKFKRLAKNVSKEHLGKMAMFDRKVASQFLDIPTSSIVSFPTPSDTSGSTDTGSTISYDNNWSNTETTTQSSNEKPGSDKLNTLKFERTQALEDSATMVSESDATETQAALEEKEARLRDTRELKDMVRERVAEDLGKSDAVKSKSEVRDLSLRHRGAEEAKDVAYDNREKINISDEKKEEILYANDLKSYERREARAHKRAVNAEIARLNEKAARQRDTRELKDMVRERVAEDLGKSDAVKSKSEVRDLSLRHRGAEEAKEVAYDNRAKMGISDMEKLRILNKNREEREERKLAKQLQSKQETPQSDGASEIRNINEAANKIQRARRAQLARRKAAELKAEAERQGKIQEHRENAAAKKITDALRANKERNAKRREAERQAQIDGDYELAKKLQAEYDAEDRQIREDRKYARKLQKKLDKKAVKEQIKADRKLARQLQAEEIAAQIESDRQLAEQVQAEEVAAQIAEDHRLAKQTQEKFDEERRVAAMPRQQEEFRQRAVGDSEAVETDHWSLPEATKFQFRNFDFESRAYQMQGRAWAYQLKELSIRKTECILWLLVISYWDLLQNGGETGSAEIYEAVCNVKDIFPKAGPEAKSSPAIVNVYNAFENTSPAGFVRDLTALGSRELNGVLYFVARKYMQSLMDGKKAADKKFIELAKAAVEHFDRAWEAKHAEVFKEEEGVPEVDNSESSVVNENRQEPAVSATAGVQGIVETERAEDTEWDIPYVLHEVLKWPLGSYRGGDNRRVYLGKFNEALQDLGIRRLEALMYLAACSYQSNKVQGRGALGEQSLKLAKDICDNVFPTALEIKPNARLVNCCRALENMHDKPLYFGELDHYGRYSFENNDMKTYEGSFQGAFRRITAGEQEVVLGKIATLYREKLREGKRPSSMLFVDFADEICKELNLDGFFSGEDTEEDHPAWDKVNKRPMWEFRKEFESDVQPAVVNPQNADQNTVIAEDPETNPWRMPEGVNRALMYDPNIDGTEVLNEGEGLNVQAALQRLTVRQLEAVIGLSVCTYKSRSGAKNMYGKVETAISNEMLEKAGKLWSLILSAPKGDNERLLHVYNALRSASNAKSLTGDLNSLPLRKVESFLGMAFLVYNDKLRHGAVPANEAFVTMTNEVLELLDMNYDEEETPAEDEIRHGALDDDNRALVEPIGA